jgi:hypothetical protein
MSDLVSQVRKWLGFDPKPAAREVSEEDLERAEGEGMAPPDMETPSPQLDDLQ